MQAGNNMPLSFQDKIIPPVTPNQSLSFASKVTPPTTPPISNEVQNEKNAPKLEQFLTGAGKDLLGQAQGTSDLINKVSSFIPQSLKTSIAQQHPQLAGILGIISKVSPTISKIEQSVGQQQGSLTKLNTGFQKAGAVAERAVEVAPGVASLGETAIKNAASLIADNKALTAKNLENLFGTITQGKIGDIPKAKIALQEINPTNINTYSDLGTALDTKIKTISTALDKTLETNPTPYKINDLNKTLKVGDTEVQHNYVKDALNQLEDFFAKTGNVEKENQIIQLKVKANEQGLTIKELNNLARLHGQELNGFNANGELANGLTKQLAENTRAGLKSTARELFGNDAYDAADQVLSDTIQTRDLVRNVEEQVNKLNQKVVKRGLGEKVGTLVSQVLDKVSGGTLKGFVQNFLPKGQGLKVMNPLDLEANLSKNLKAVQTILDSNLPEQTIIQRLQEIQKSAQESKLLPAPKTTDSFVLKKSLKEGVSKAAGFIPALSIFGNKDKALKNKEKEVSGELRSYVTSSLFKKEANTQLDEMLRLKKYSEARNFVKSQLEKIIRQTSDTPTSQEYYQNLLNKFNRRFKE